MELDEGYLEAFDIWAGAAERVGGAPSFMEFAEFDIATDPTEAPADAMLEAAGYYVEPGDACLFLWWGKSVIHRKGGGAFKGGSSHAHLTQTLVGDWDPYSWDVKPEVAFVAMVKEAMAKMHFSPNDYGPNYKPAKPATCNVCNGTRLVDGFLGVGIQIPCGQCGGEGSL